MNFNSDAGAIKLAKRVEKWQRRLAALGVAHWDLKSVSIIELDGAEAAVRTSNTYDSCRFFFDSDFLDECTKRELDHAICHEWMHVAMRDLDRVTEQAESWMPEATYKDYMAHVCRARERVVDNVARALHAAHTDTPIRNAPSGE